MATIKAFSDLEQSRKLAEILPLESADMYYSKHDTIHANTLYGSCDIQYFSIHEYIPCWSLAALLGVLPRIDIEKEICSDDTYDYRVKAYIGDGYVGDWYDNPVDACVEMIEKLHELNLL